MAFSYEDFLGNGVTTQYAVNKPYINRAHITLTVDGVAQTITWINASLVSVAVAPANGTVVRVKRTTPSTALTNFSNGSSLGDEDLDRVLTQSLYINEESADTAADSLKVAADGTFAAGSRRISAMANPTAAQDAVTKAYGDANYGGAVSAAAIAAKDEAVVAKDAAVAAKDQAVAAAAALPTPVASTFIQRNAGNTAYDTKTAADVLTTIAAAPTARTITAGVGLAGGGDLSANRSLAADVASQAEAEAGASAAKLMTPQRTAQAITALAAAGIGAVSAQVFATPGANTWTKPAGVKFVKVVCVGAGGGGGGSVNIAGAGGGGGGGYSEKIIDVTALASATVTVGAAGAAGSSAGGAGGAGGDTSFGASCIGKGGAGGAGRTTTAASVPGGAGGIVGTGDVSIAGRPGYAGLNPSNTFIHHGGGGDTALGFGYGGRPTQTTGDVAGAPGVGYGGGGGGALFSSVSQAGATGAAGICIVYEFK